LDEEEEEEAVALRGPEEPTEQGGDMFVLWEQKAICVCALCVVAERLCGKGLIRVSNGGDAGDGFCSHMTRGRGR
jgi:hypothetical protein